MYPGILGGPWEVLVFFLDSGSLGEVLRETAGGAWEGTARVGEPHGALFGISGFKQLSFLFVLF